MGFSDLRQELVASVESDLFTTNASKLEPEDIVQETEAYFETLTSVESSIDAIELSDASAKVLEEAIAEMESDNFDAAIAKANAVHELITGQPLELATVEADNEESKKSIIEKIKEFLRNILNYIKKKGKAIWNKIYTLFQKIKNIVAGYVGKKLVSRKLDKFLEECKDKKPGREFNKEEVEKLAKELYIYADANGNVNVKSFEDSYKFVQDALDITDVLKKELTDISKDLVNKSGELAKIVDKIKGKRIISLKDGKWYTVKCGEEECGLVEISDLSKKPDNVKSIEVLTDKKVEELKGTYEKYLGHYSKLFSAFGERIKSFDGILNKIEEEADKLKDDAKVEEVKKGIELYRKLALHVLPKLYVLGIENIRIGATPKIGGWLDLSCKVLKENSKQEESKKEEK